jgi:hypothetical protein
MLVPTDFSTRSPVDAATKKLYDDVKPSLVRVSSENNEMGSGVIVDSNHVLTAKHIVHDDKNVHVVTNRGTILKGEVTEVDPYSDAALIRLTEAPPKNEVLKPIALGNSNLTKGQTLMSFGYPLPGSDDLDTILAVPLFVSSGKFIEKTTNSELNNRREADMMRAVGIAFKPDLQNNLRRTCHQFINKQRQEDKNLLGGANPPEIVADVFVENGYSGGILFEPKTRTVVGIASEKTFKLTKDGWKQQAAFVPIEFGRALLKKEFSK